MFCINSCTQVSLAVLMIEVMHKKIFIVGMSHYIYIRIGDYGKCRMSTTEDFMGTSSIPGQSFPVDGMSSGMSSIQQNLHAWIRNLIILFTEQLTEETMSTTKTIHTCSILCQSLPANGSYILYIGV